MAQLAFNDMRWSTFVEQAGKDVSFYYSPAWLDLISTLYGYAVIPLTTMNEVGEITGFLPLCLIKSPLTGRRLVSLPFSDHCPLLARDEDSASQLIDQAIDLAKQEHVRYLELRTGTEPLLSKRADLVEVDLYVRWVLPLLADEDAMWKTLRKPIQHQIKKSRKLGVQVRIAESREDMLQYYRLHLQTRSKKQGMPAQSPKFFLKMWDVFSESDAVKVLLAEHEGNVVAGMVLLASGTTLRYSYGASDERFLHLAPNNLLLWTAMTWGGAHGCQTLDLGRTACDNEGLMEFKRRWGAIKEPLPYYYYPKIAGLASTSEQSWKFHLLTSCWRKLPLSISGPLGSKLYKHMG